MKQRGQKGREGEEGGRGAGWRGQYPGQRLRKWVWAGTSRVEGDAGGRESVRWVPGTLSSQLGGAGVRGWVEDMVSLGHPPGPLWVHVAPIPWAGQGPLLSGPSSAALSLPLPELFGG